MIRIKGTLIWQNAQLLSSKTNSYVCGLLMFNVFVKNDYLRHEHSTENRYLPYCQPCVP